MQFLNRKHRTLSLYIPWVELLGILSGSINFIKWGIKIQFCLVLKRNHAESLVFKCSYEFEGFQIAICGCKILFLILSQNFSCKNISYQVVLVIQEPFPPSPLRFLLKLLIFSWKEQNPGLHHFTLAKGKMRSFIMLTEMKSFTPFIIH